MGAAELGLTHHPESFDMRVQMAIRHRYFTVLVEHLQGYFINFTAPLAVLPSEPLGMIVIAPLMLG